MTGKVALVGAGPGDPDLITVKGLRLLQNADVVLYDRLIPMSLLEQVRPTAELIHVGKTPYQRGISQAEINALMIEKAQQGHLVVRLKGGDPFVFGRGAEEALACHQAGIAFEVVPGVSSAIAAPAYAGIPVTHRHISTAFTVFTGHEDPTKADGQTDYAALSRVGTLVLLMGVAHLAGITERLITAGLDPDTPAACIEWASTDHQRVVIGTAGTIAQRVLDAGIDAPATTVIGAVVSLAAQGVAWFDPLTSDHDDP
ncbi:MAG: uroporphyrinogen-III C-methyltransferase [Anaerolineae bacterium]|jgi:uroporphyrin-III C-methyltransferase|nr:uroporphyrinogen-III C-methyltransferase [Anaerolineae bacterium]